MKKLKEKVYPYHSWIYYDPKTRKAIQVIDRPTVFILLNNKKAHKISKTPVMCLVDSGSDRNLFPASWGELVGLKIKNKNKRIIRGIGGIKIKAWTHRVTLLISTDFTISTEVDFSYEQQVPLLGMDGFLINS